MKNQGESMKRLFVLPVILMFCLSLSVSVFAAEDDESSEEITDSDISSSAEVEATDSDTTTDIETSSDTEEDSSESTTDESNITYDLDEASGSSGMSAVIEELFGEYSPRTYTVTETSSDGSEETYTQIVPGLAGLDYSWLVSVSIFALSLYCLFRMIGGILKWN